MWRSQVTPVVRESENAGHLDLLGGSCLMLARTALAGTWDHQHVDQLLPNVLETPKSGSLVGCCQRLTAARQGQAACFRERSMTLCSAARTIS
jgi:hypothetical protein